MATRQPILSILKRPWGLLPAVFPGGTAVTLLLGGRWVDRRGRKPPILIGSAIVAATALFLRFSHALGEAAVASLLSGVGTGLLNPPVNASVGDVTAGQSRDVISGTALAGFQMIGDIGAVVGPVVAGLLVETTGYPAAFATTAVIAAISFFAWLGTPETLPR